jgi:hypothetical protein
VLRPSEADRGGKPEAAWGPPAATAGWLVLAPLLAGCGLGLVDETSGGAANLPTLGAGPFGRLPIDLSTPADEPFVLDDRTADFTDVACLPRADGGLRLWFAWARDADPAPVIGYAELPSVYDLPDLPPRPVVTGGPGTLGAPAVIAEPEGGLRMYLQVDDGIGVTTSSDDGVSWSAITPALADAAAPTATIVDGTTHLFFVRDGAIWRARSAGGAAFVVDPEPAITARPGVPGAFDAATVGDPFVLVQRSDAGRRHWGLWFSGQATAGGNPAIGFAGSFDGSRWERFAGVDPVLTPSAAGPCALLEGPRAFLFYHDVRNLRRGIGAAVHP